MKGENPNIEGGIMLEGTSTPEPRLNQTILEEWPLKWQLGETDCPKYQQHSSILNRQLERPYRLCNLCYALITR